MAGSCETTNFLHSFKIPLLILDLHRVDLSLGFYNCAGESNLGDLASLKGKYFITFTCSMILIKLYHAISETIYLRRSRS